MITSAEEFVRLRTSDLPEDYHRAAHDAASDAVWAEVIDKHPDMRQWVAYNKTVPLDVLERLGRDSDEAVRWFVAMRRKCSPELLTRLAEDVDDGVRVRVARNKSTLVETLQLLSTDESWVVRQAAEQALSKRDQH